MKLKNVLKIKRGISLIVLIVTIIVVIILVAVVILTISKDGGIINKARYAKDEYNKIEYKDRINEAYTIVKNKQEMQGKTDREIFEEVKKSLNFEKAKYEISDKSMNITTKEGYEYTLTGDGNIYDEKVAILDIADGTIQLYKDGYVQGTNSKVQYGENGGKYIITGTTTENAVEVKEDGIYDVTIKNLNIDFTNSSINKCSFNSNAGNKATGCFVILTLEGHNYLYGKGKPGLSVSAGTPNVDGVTNGSMLEIQGSGNLEVKGIGGYASGIGSNEGDANNITINSGNITAIGSYGPGIGGNQNKNVNNIIINGGNVYAEGGCRSGIGSWGNGLTDNIIINGGNITAIGGEYAKGGIESKNLIITGGNIIAGNKYNGYQTSLRGEKINISGGTIYAVAARSEGITCEEGGTINITGGSILARGKNNLNIVAYSGSTLVAYNPKKGTDYLYETPIKLDGVAEGKKITKLTTSDNINYGINDMYTLEEGMLYMYLPLGKREVTIKVDGKTYKGEVETKEEGNITVLSEM